MLRIFIITLLCMGLLSSCKNRKASVEVSTEANFLSFDLEKGVENIGNDTISLNDISNDISFLKLDETIPLQSLNMHFFEFGDGYAVSSGAMRSATPIMLFTLNGVFEKILVRQGRGPWELPYYLTWTVNNNTKELVVGGDVEIVVYSSEYNTGKKIRADGHAGGLIPLNDSSYVVRSSLFGSEQDNAPFLSFFNSQGLTVKELRGRNNFVSLPQGQGVWPLESYGLFHSSSGDAIFKDMFNDTLFVVSSIDDFRPYLHLNRGKRIPRNEDNFDNEKNRDKIFFEHLLESDRYLVLSYALEELVHCAVMDKTDGRIISNFAGDPERTVRTNGFMRYKTPAGDYLTVDIVSVSRNTMYCQLSPIDAMKFVDGITEDSNPVILIAKLK